MESVSTMLCCKSLRMCSIRHRVRRYHPRAFILRPPSGSSAKFFLIFEVGYVAAIIPIKLSISWMLIRVAEGRKMYVYIQYCVIGLFATMNIIALIFILINCIPVEYDPPLVPHLDKVHD